VNVVEFFFSPLRDWSQSLQDYARQCWYEHQVHAHASDGYLMQGAALVDARRSRLSVD
jgi:hypothetical protein